MKETDFTINMRPESISFECPYCKSDVTINWRDLYVPEYWGDDWGEVECPHCDKTVLLGDYELD